MIGGRIPKMFTRVKFTFTNGHFIALPLAAV